MMSKAVRKTKGTPDPIDVHVGNRLRVRRSLLGMSQERLADSIGLTFQQIQKYERGTNRISAGRLYQFSKILEVPISYFYEQFGDSPALMHAMVGLSDNAQDDFEGLNSGANFKDDVMNTKETLDLVRAYYSIQDPKVRKDMLRLIKSVSQTSSLAENDE